MRFRVSSTATVFLLIGIPFLITGVIVGLLVPRVYAQQKAAVATFAPLTLQEAQKTAVGQTILLEGVVGSDNAELTAGFVAYDLYEQSADEELVFVERVAPSLTLQLPDGLVRIENADYEFRATAKTADHDDRYYRGFGRRDPVFVVGTLTAAGTVPTITADFLSAGTQADFVAEQNLYIGGWWLFAGLFIIIGLGMVGTAVFLSFR